MPPYPPDDAEQVVTVSIEYGRMSGRVQKGDLIRVQSRVVDVGSSSLTIETVLLREHISKFPTEAPSFHVVMQLQLTFVAVCKEGRPYRNVPRLSDADDSALARSEHARLVKKTVREIENGGKWTEFCSDGIENRKCDTFHDQRLSWTKMTETTALFSKQYLPRHENFGGIVFGGDVLLMLERAAVYCGRRFTRESHIQCIAVYDVHFKVPIKPTSILLVTARVVYVRQYCIEVEVVVNTDRSHEGVGPERSHTAYFTIVTHDGTGRLLPIRVGLSLEGADEESKRAYKKAKFRTETASWIPEEDAALPNMLVAR
jgi:acyl-CoA hydrolase